MSQEYRYPNAASVTVSAIGGNGAPIPTQSILIAGENPSLNLQPLQTDAGGALIVSPLTSVSVVTANQGSANSSANRWPVYLTDGTNNNSFTANGLKIDGSAVTQPISATQLPVALGQGLMAASLSVAIASNQSVLSVSAASLPLPAGAATSAIQTNGSQKSQIVDGSGNVIAATANALNVNLTNASVAVTGTVAVSGTVTVAGTATVSGTVAATQSGNWSTRTQDGSGTGITSTAEGSKVGLNTSELGFSSANAPVINNYGSVNITTGAYVQLVASLTSDCQEIEIFDSSGQSLYLATGAAASEVNQMIIFPGGNGRVKLRIAAGTRISAKAISANATSGSLYINLYG